MENNVWINGKNEYVKCSLCRPTKVTISALADRKIKYVMKQMNDIEWACDLIGRGYCGLYYVEDIYIYEQIVSESYIERIGEEHIDSIGSLHSHHSMGSFFSHVDVNEAFSNHDLLGVIDNKHEYKFLVKATTPCNHIAVLEPEVIIEEDITVNLTPIKIRNRSLIENYSAYYDSMLGKYYEK